MHHFDDPLLLSPLAHSPVRQQRSLPAPKDGGAAFPMYGVTSAVQHGISARDYFACRAPAEIPDWFRIDPGNTMPALPSPDGLTQSQRTEFDMVVGGQLDEKTASLEVQVHLKQYRAAKGKQDEWRRQMREKKFFAWRWHYADRMLEGRK